MKAQNSKFKVSKLFDLDGNVAAVTGGCGNLGPFWVMALLNVGAKVAIIDLPNTKLPKILEKENQNGVVKLYHSDITSLTNLTQIHKKIKEELGLVDILVNNAGIDIPPVTNTSGGGRLNPPAGGESHDSPEVKMWQVNVQGAVNCIEEFSPDMKEKKKGTIINIGSLYLERSPYQGLYTHLNFDKPWVYGSTKAALHQVTKHFATRLAKSGIRVNTLSPGGVLGGQDKEFIRRYSARVPLGRMAQKEIDLGGPLIFLASDASSYVTGINLQVNGGYTAW